MICLTNCNSGDHIKRDEVDRAFGMFGSQEWCIQGFGGETWGERHHLEDLGVDGRLT